MRAQARPAGDEAAEHVAVLPVPGGSEAGFADFVRSSSAELGRVAWFLCGDRTRAEDLLQHAYLRTWSHWDRVRTGDPLAYTRRVLANARIDAWRLARREVLSGDVPERSTPSGAAVADERDALVRALRLLPTQQRRIVVLRHLAGLSEAEVADELRVSLGTVKAAASRGLARLRTQLGDDEGGAR
jgi:RNA polymerase sigma-70 factor (sigma-E family)